MPTTEGRIELLSRGPSSGWTTLGDAVVPRRVRLVMEGDADAPTTTMVFEPRDGQLACVTIACEPKPGGRGVRHADLAGLDVEATTAEVYRRVAVPRAADAPARATREHLEEVARIHQAHRTASPTRMVALVLGISQRTAERRVEQARAAGLLP